MASAGAEFCYCPWCANCRHSVNTAGFINHISFKFHSPISKLVVIVLLLLSGSCVSYPMVSAMISKDAIVSRNTDSLSSPSDILSQTVTLTSDPDSDCLSGTKPECTCTVLWKCKKCSRFEMSRHVHYCLYTGYKQYVYCSNSKSKKKYLSCQPSSAGSNEYTHFWIFELIVGFGGLLSLLVVRYRTNIQQRQFARRIQRQLNA